MDGAFVPLRLRKGIAFMRKRGEGKAEECEDRGSGSLSLTNPSAERERGRDNLRRGARGKCSFEKRASKGKSIRSLSIYRRLALDFGGGGGGKYAQRLEAKTKIRSKTRGENRGETGLSTCCWDKEESLDLCERYQMPTQRIYLTVGRRKQKTRRFLLTKECPSPSVQKGASPKKTDR